MIGLILATIEEARPLLALLAARKLAREPFETYTFAAAGARPGGMIVISGMGRYAAARAAEHLTVRRGATVVVNVGVCGVLAEESSCGQILRIDTVLDGDRALAGEPDETLVCEAEPWDELPSSRLGTVEEPVFQNDRRQRLSRSADVVDMEGFAVAQICRRHGVAVHMLKGVTDRADHAGRENIRRNIESVSLLLAEGIATGLAHLPQPRLGPMSTMIRFTKIEHSLFSIPLLLAGAYLGAGRTWPPVPVLGLIALAGIGARTLGMAANRILDRDLDALNRRTADRELPSRRMSPATAYGIAGGALMVYLLACAGLGRLCLTLSPIPAVPLLLYPLLKRFTNLCHFGIGLCLALGPLGAFVAASGHVEFSAQVLLLAVCTFCWISGFDIIYALQDMDSDRETGVCSLPAALGSGRAQAVAAAMHLAAVAAIVWLWSLVGGVLPGVFLAVALGGLAAAHWQRIPLRVRFFPLSAVTGIAASMIPLSGGSG